MGPIVISLALNICNSDFQSLLSVTNDITYPVVFVVVSICSLYWSKGRLTAIDTLPIIPLIILARIIIIFDETIKSQCMTHPHEAKEYAGDMHTLILLPEKFDLLY